jgi:hypothetical protein
VNRNHTFPHRFLLWIEFGRGRIYAAAAAVFATSDRLFATAHAAAPAAQEFSFQPQSPIAQVHEKNDKAKNNYQ